MSKLIDGLGPNGKLIVVGVDFEPVKVRQYTHYGVRAIHGWVAGMADSEDTLNCRTWLAYDP